MSTEYRNFLALSYEELEEKNLEAKADRASNRAAVAARDSRKAHQVPDRREADQGRDRTVQRPGRPPSSARLRQEVPAWRLREPSPSSGSIDPRIHRAERERPHAWDIDWSARIYWVPADVFARQRQGTGLRNGHRQGRHSPIPATCAACSRAYSDKLYEEKQLYANAALQRDRGLPVCQAATRRRIITRPCKFDFINTGGLLLTCCRSIHCACSSTHPLKCSAQWDSRTRRITPKLRPANLKSSYSYTAK